MATNTVTTGFRLPSVVWGNENEVDNNNGIIDSYFRSLDPRLKLFSSFVPQNAVITTGGKIKYYSNGSLQSTRIFINARSHEYILWEGKHSFEIIADIFGGENEAPSDRRDSFISLKNNGDEWNIAFSINNGFELFKNGTPITLQNSGTGANVTNGITLKVRVMFWNDGSNNKIAFEFNTPSNTGEIPYYIETGNPKNITSTEIRPNLANITRPKRLPIENLTIWDIEDEITSGKNLKDNIGTSVDFQKQRFEFPLAQKSDDVTNQNVKFYEASATDWTPTPSGSTVFDVLTDGNPNTFAEVGSAKTGLEQTNVDASAIPFNADGSPFVFSKIVGVRQVAARVADDDAEQVNFQIQAPTAKQTDGTTNHTIQNEQTATLTAPIGQSGFMAKTWDFSSEPIDASLSDLRGSMSK